MGPNPFARNLLNLRGCPRGYGKDENEAIISRLYEEIGRLKVDLDYLKKRV